MQTIPVVAGYVRPVAANLTLSKTSHSVLTEHEDIVEPYEEIDDLVEEEQVIQDELQHTVWNNVSHHAAKSSAITTLGIITIMAILIIGIIQIRKCVTARQRSKPKTPKAPRAPGDEEEEIELRPLSSRTTCSSQRQSHENNIDA